MKIRKLTIPNAWEFTPTQHSDDRGLFFEFYRFEQLEETIGHSLKLRQGNTSVSARGVVRGIHYALVPPGQGKYVTVSRGAMLDYVIDLRIGSPTFGEWDSVLLDEVDRRSVYLAEGLGHAIVALTADATVSYLVSEVFNPTRELGIDVLDPEIGLVFPVEIEHPLLSSKDTDAPTLSEAVARKLLPTWQESLALYAALESRDR